MRGFTLLEILISVMILGIILAVIYTAYTANVDAVQHARLGSQRHQTARIVLERMSKDMESAFIGTFLPQQSVRLGLIGENAEMDDRPADRVHFTALAHLVTEDGKLQTDLCELSYYLEEGPDEEGAILYRRDSGIVDDDLASGGVASAFSSMVSAMDIRYLDGLGNDFEFWDTTEGEHKDTLPVLVEIKLTLRDSEGKEEVFTASIHPALAEMKAESEMGDE